MERRNWFLGLSIFFLFMIGGILIDDYSGVEQGVTFVEDYLALLFGLLLCVVNYAHYEPIFVHLTPKRKIKIEKEHQKIIAIATSLPSNS